MRKSTSSAALDFHALTRSGHFSILFIDGANSLVKFGGDFGSSFPLLDSL